MQLLASSVHDNSKFSKASSGIAKLAVINPTVEEVNSNLFSTAQNFKNWTASAHDKYRFLCPLFTSQSQFLVVVLYYCRAMSKKCQIKKCLSKTCRISFNCAVLLYSLEFFAMTQQQQAPKGRVVNGQTNTSGPNPKNDLTPETGSKK